MKNTVRKISVMDWVRSPTGLIVVAGATLLVTGFTLSGTIAFQPSEPVGSEPVTYV